MGPVFHSHQPQFVIDEETWDAFLQKAEARKETVGELVAYAIERFMEQEGFAPAWATQPTEISLTRPGPRRRRPVRPGERPAPEHGAKS
jgi:hypothetical protein